MRVRFAITGMFLFAQLTMPAQQKWEEKSLDDQVRVVSNRGGSALGYSAASGTVSLQYGDYKADKARDKSLAAGDPTEPGLTNRGYKGKTVSTANSNDLQVILDTKKAMNGKPVVVAMSLSNPAAVSEFEREVNAIKEDLPHDMKPHVDAVGNKYDFGFGLNWKGKINDARVKKYVKIK
jgi:beta-glucosidase